MNGWPGPRFGGGAASWRFYPAGGSHRDTLRGAAVAGEVTRATQPRRRSRHFVLVAPPPHGMCAPTPQTLCQAPMLPGCSQIEVYGAEWSAQVYSEVGKPKRASHAWFFNHHIATHSVAGAGLGGPPNATSCLKPPSVSHPPAFLILARCTCQALQAVELAAQLQAVHTAPRSWKGFVCMRWRGEGHGSQGSRRSGSSSSGQSASPKLGLAGWVRCKQGSVQGSAGTKLKVCSAGSARRGGRTEQNRHSTRAGRILECRQMKGKSGSRLAHVASRAA